MEFNNYSWFKWFSWGGRWNEIVLWRVRNQSAGRKWEHYCKQWIYNAVKLNLLFWAGIHGPLGPNCPVFFALIRSKSSLWSVSAGHWVSGLLVSNQSVSVRESLLLNRSICLRTGSLPGVDIRWFYFRLNVWFKILIQRIWRYVIMESDR